MMSLPRGARQLRDPELCALRATLRREERASQPVFWTGSTRTPWRVVTAKAIDVTAEFDYFATRSTSRSHAFQVTSGSSSHQSVSLRGAAAGATSRGPIHAARRWQVTTGAAGQRNGPYTAPNYHELVDAQTFVGKYSLDSLQVDGKSIRIRGMAGRRLHNGGAANMRTGREDREERNALFGGPPYEALHVSST